MGQHFFDFNRYLGSGIQNFDQISYLYQYPSTYKDPNFFRFRKKVNQIIKKYIKIQEKLADKLNFYTKKIDEVKQKGKKVIGIHARCASYFFYNNEPENYLDQIKKDIDDVMKRSDPGNTVIFLATIVEPLKQYIEENYEVILQDIPRSTDALLGDWTEIEHPDPTTIPEQVIIDTWTLANCDELWGGASNVVLFAACLNPELKICFFPFIENCQGS
jgi:hypothetical protein